ncbi:MAG: DUF1990 family protein [Rubrobacteraceae bacterium]|jgi:uncharacterized protein (UPF0548 family)
MFLLRKPDEEAIGCFIGSQESLPFSYREIGATRTGIAPKGYVADRYRVKIGEGEDAYRRAVDALRGWRQFGIGWTSLRPPGAPIEDGSVVAVLVRHFGFRSLNPARIVYTIEDPGPLRRFGFAYGTLPGHSEKGEELFSIEWDREEGSVHYAVFAFSRPNHPLVWLGYPFTRMLQKRFIRDSQRAMAEAAAGMAAR